MSALTTEPTLGPISLDLRGVSRADTEVVAEILRDLKSASDRVVKAARKWVELPEETRTAVVEGSPRTLRDVWARLDRIGTGAMHPLLWSMHGHAANLLAKLPMDQQEKFLAEKVPVAVVSASGRADIHRIAIEDMGAETRLQVFAVRGNQVTVRTVAEQRAWLVEKSRKEALAAERESQVTRIERPGRWVVEKGRVFPDAARVESGFTLADVLKMVKDLRQ